MSELAGATPLNPALAEKLHKYGLAKCVYAAAHDIEPWTVDETDGGYTDVCELIAEDWNATLEPLALALGMPDDSDYAAILQRVTARSAADYATAYASLHEVVRAFLAGERNTKYLRRLHAEIEAHLTGGEGRG